MIWKLQQEYWLEELPGSPVASRTQVPALPGPSLVPHRIMTRGVDNVYCSHVLIQEVTADGNCVAATTVVFLNGDPRGESGSCRAEAAPEVE